MTSSTANFLTSAAQCVNSPARFVKTLVFTLLYSVVGSVPLIVVMVMRGATSSEDLNAQTLGLHEALFFALLMLPELTLLWGLFRQVRKQHGQDWARLITPRREIHWGKMLYAGAVWGGLTLAVELGAFALNADRYTVAFEPSVFVPLVLAVLLLVPFQASFEEIAFRGYLMQQTALISRRVWMPLVLTSFVFAALHLANPEVEAYGVARMFPGYFLVGLMFGIATLMDNGLELAMGAHTANNIIAFVVVSEPHSVMKTPTLLTAPASPPTLASYAVLLLCGGVFLALMARAYNWGSFSRLLATIEFPPPPQEQASEPQHAPNIA
jgi:membrane protease YdiL (CAAX protease family)